MCKQEEKLTLYLDEAGRSECFPIESYECAMIAIQDWCPKHPKATCTLVIHKGSNVRIESYACYNGYAIRTPF